MKEHTIRTIRALLESPSYDEEEADGLETTLRLLNGGTIDVLLVDEGYLVVVHDYWGRGTRNDARLRAINSALSKEGFKLALLTNAQKIKYKRILAFSTGNRSSTAFIATKKD